MMYDWKGWVCTMMKCSVMVILAISLLASLLSGCSRDTAKDEMRKYNMQAYRDGNKAAESQGLGLNGQFLDTMQQLFKDMNIQLTNETYAEDDAGNMSYQYRMNNDSSQLITVYIFTDEQARVNAMKELYGVDGINDTGEMNHNRIIGLKEAALVYTSGGIKRDQYTEQVNQVALKVLQHVPRRSNSMQMIIE